MPSSTAGNSGLFARGSHGAEAYNRASQIVVVETR